MSENEPTSSEPPRPDAATEDTRSVRILSGLEKEEAERFNRAGILTMADVTRSEPATLAERSGLAPDRVRRLYAMADLLRVPVIDPATADLLVHADVDSTRSLADADPEALASTIQAVNRTGSPVPSETIDRWIAAAQGVTPLPAASVKPTAQRMVVISTRGYWISLTLSLAILVLAFGLYAAYLPPWAFFVYAAIIVCALLVITVAVFGLARRGRVVHRSLRGTRRAASSLAEGIRNRSERHEGAMARFASRVGGFFAGIGRLIRAVVMLPWRILRFFSYNGVKAFWWVLLAGYDIVYYVPFWAWIIIVNLWRAAKATLWFLLKIAWRIVKIVTFLPLVRKVWRQALRPKILENWRQFQTHRAHRRALKIENGRRLAVTRGQDPDRWEADRRMRHGFLLMHPDAARVRIRKRIARINEVQRARRQGRPVPRRRPVATEPPNVDEGQPPAYPAPETSPGEPAPSRPPTEESLKKRLKVVGGPRTRPPKRQASEPAPTEA